MMNRIAIFVTILAFIPLGLPAIADDSHPEMLAPIDLSTPEATAFSMMRAMYQGDADLVDQVFASDAELRRVTSEGDLRPDGLRRWRDWVGTLAIGDAHEELFGVTSQTFGNLATVWAPFVITYNGELVGCGINQLSMAKTNDAWRVVFAMDTNAPKNSCSTFKADYLASQN